MTISSFNSLCFISLEKERATDTPGGHLHLLQLRLSFIKGQYSLLEEMLRVFINIAKYQTSMLLYFCLKHPELIFRGNIQFSLSFKMQTRNKQWFSCIHL